MDYNYHIVWGSTKGREWTCNEGLGKQRFELKNKSRTTPERGTNKQTNYKLNRN